MKTLRTPRIRSQEQFLRQLNQASRQMTPAGPSRLLTFADVRSANIDVAAQQALVAMSQQPALRSVATGLAGALSTGLLGGIFRENQQVPALIARRLGFGWWQIVPPRLDAALLFQPDQALAAPVVVLRNQVADAWDRLTRSLAQAWEAFQLWRRGGLTQCRQAGGIPVPFFVPLLCLPPGRPTLSLLAYAAGYLNPQPTQAAEVAALNAGAWEPSNEDFAAIASRSTVPLTVATDSLSTLLNVLNGQPVGSIRGLGLVGHSNPSFFSFSGNIGMTTTNGRPHSVVTFDRSRAISKENLESLPVKDFIDRNKLWDRFAPGGEIILYGCRSGSRISTEETPAELLVALSRAFRVCVRGFRHKICTFLGHRGQQITQRGLVRYDPQGSACTGLARPPFQTLNELVPDGPPACQGITPSDIRPAREALLAFGR